MKDAPPPGLRAQWDSTCPLCDGLITLGVDRVVFVDGKQTHVTCFRDHWRTDYDDGSAA